MLTTDDREWLRVKHSQLTPSEVGVAGAISIDAAYDPTDGLFRSLTPATEIEAAAIRLAGEFTIRIEKRTSESFSRLPALYIDGVSAAPGRHISPDGTACLCSPLEEDEFLIPDFNFQAFLERLVVPFLYGQLFYSANHRWPWPDYSHSVVGLFESYARFPEQSKAEDLLQTLTRFSIWPKVRAVLWQRDYIKGHTPCFCEKRDHMRRCHPAALQGIRTLQEGLRASGKPIP